MYDKGVCFAEVFVPEMGILLESSFKKSKVTSKVFRLDVMTESEGIRKMWISEENLT